MKENILYLDILRKEITVASMILAVDVYYRDNGACAACVAFRNWDDRILVFEKTVFLPEAETYTSGSFYLRELPCIIALLNKVKDKPGIIVIDGYVWLGKDKKPGLGMHLYNALYGRSAVVGVAKTRYSDTPAYTELCRGNSTRPLYITAAGIDEDEAKDHVSNMYGTDRIPFLIKRADRLSRQLN